MAQEATGSLFDNVIQNVRQAAESNLKMQQEAFRTWATLWPGMPSWPGMPTPQSLWFDKMREFQTQWTQTISDLARKHREVLDRQYQAALESLEEALRVTASKDPEEFRKRSEQLCRKTLDCIREISEVQLKEFQEAVSKWSELATKAAPHA